jgi:hypothetical protein
MITSKKLKRQAALAWGCTPSPSVVREGEQG